MAPETTWEFLLCRAKAAAAAAAALLTGRWSLQYLKENVRSASTGVDANRKWRENVCTCAQKHSNLALAQLLLSTYPGIRATLLAQQSE